MCRTIYRCSNYGDLCHPSQGQRWPLRNLNARTALCTLLSGTAYLIWLHLEMTTSPPQQGGVQPDAAYTLHVVGASKLPSTLYGNSPNAYVELKVGPLSMRTQAIKRSDDPRWNHDFHFVLNNSQTNFTILVIHRAFSPLLPDVCLGRLDGIVEEYVTKCAEHQGHITVDLRDPKNQYWSGGRGSIEFAVVKQDPIAAGSSAVAEARRVTESAGLLVPDRGKALAISANSIDPLANIVSKLASLEKVVREMSKVHPYISAAWQVTSSLYKALKGQLDRDQSIVDLLTVMENTYSFVDVLQLLPDKMNALEDIITKIALQTVECAIFIREYVGQGFGVRVWKQTLADTHIKIDELKKSLVDLRSSLDTGVAIQTAFASIRTSKAVAGLWELSSIEGLKPAGMDASTRVECLPSTRQEILQVIIDWVLCPTHGQNIFWIVGVAGSGKSALSTTIANYFRELGRLGAFLFFDRDVSERSSPSHVIRTLAYQLGSFDEQFRWHLSLAVSNLSWQWPLQTQFEKLLSAPLSQTQEFSDQGPVVVVLDALDECGSAKTRKVLLDMLAQENWKLPSNFRIIIASRAEHDIQKFLSSQSNIATRELELTGSANMKDIELYLRHWMSIIRSNNDLLPLSTDWPGERRILDLSTRSSGLFMWASTAIVFIEDGHDPEERLRAILNHGNGSDAKFSLDELYATALKTIGKWKDDTFRSDFRTIMGTILASEDPMLPSTLDTLIKPPRPSLHTVSHLGCLIHWGPSQPLRVLHPSLTEFLTHRARCANDDWFIDITFHRRRLAHKCLEFLEENLHANVLRLKLDCNHIYHRHPVPEALAYASRFWIEHVCLVTDDVSSLVEESYSFLRQHLLHWFEVMSFMERPKEVYNLLERLMGWLKMHSYDSAPIYHFVDEARLFAQAFTNVIQQHPFAVYQTALPFTPKHNVIYKCFHDNESFPIITGSFKSIWPSPSSKIFLGHTAGVNSVSFSPDSSKIVSGSDDMTVRIWDVHSRTQTLPALHGHEASIHAVEFASDSTRIASASGDNTIRVCDACSGDILNILRGHHGAVFSIDFSPDSRKIVSGSGDTTVRIWDVESGLPVAVFSGHTDTVNSVAYLPNATQVVSCSEDQTIRIWDTNTGVDSILQGDLSPVLAVAISRDGKTIASCSRTTAIVWDATSRHELSRIAHDDTVTSIAITTNGLLAMGGSEQNIVKIWNTSSPSERPSIVRHHTDVVAGVAFNPSGTLIACGSADTEISLWDVDSIVSSSSDTDTLEHDIRSIALSADSERAVAGDENGTLRVWNARSFEPICTLSCSPGSGISAIAFFTDGKRVAAGTSDGTIFVCDITAGESVSMIPDHKGHIRSVAVSPNGKWLASSAGSDIHIRDAASGEMVSAPTSSGHVFGLRFSPDSTRLVSWGIMRVHLWDPQGGTLIQDHSMASNMHVSSFRFSSTQIVYYRDTKDASAWIACDPMYILNGGYNRGCIFSALHNRAIAIIPPQLNTFSLPFAGSTRAAAFARGREVVVMHFPPSVLKKWTSSPGSDNENSDW